MQSIELEIGSDDSRYSVTGGAGILSGLAASIKNLKQLSPEKIVILSNETVFPLYGEELADSFREAGFETSFSILPDGEQYKNFECLTKSLNSFAEARLNRTDAVIALGGGVVGDLAGFASSIYMRGIPYVQVPTTLLAMVDSSIGGKTGINTPYGKNLAGTFYPPRAVFADVYTLNSLEPRELRAGYYEVIKHGAIGGPEIFEQAAGFLRDYPLDRFAHFSGDSDFTSDLIKLISAQISQKAKIVEQDKHEDPTRHDEKSRKILNFGHTLAHALEKTTGYSYFRHGEAVAYGMLAASEIAKKLEYCDNNSIKLLNDVIHRVGKLPDGGEIDIDAVLEAVAFDKKAVGRAQQWVLLDRIGCPRIVSGELIEGSLIRESLSKALRK